MGLERLLNQILGTLRDQRFLFLIAVIIALAILARVNVLSDVIVALVFGLSVGSVVIDRVFEFFGPRRLNEQVRSLGMSIALDFEGISEGTAIRLASGVCTIQNPLNPGQSITREVIPYPQGSGWLCPIPPEADPDDVVRIVVTDSQGGRWGTTLVPRLLWPPVNLDRL